MKQAKRAHNVLPSFHHKSFCRVYIFGIFYLFRHLHHRSNHYHFSGGTLIKNLDLRQYTDKYHHRDIHEETFSKTD